MTPERNTINNCIALLNQAIDIIKRIDNDVYVSESPILPRGSIGIHTRHVLDFYVNFMGGLRQGHINYNLRNRNARLEADRQSAIDKIDEIIADLSTIVISSPEALLRITTESDGTTKPVECASSVLRELDFLQSHTVHHYSMIATLLRLHDIEPGQEFGVAPSTLAYWKEEATCAL